MILSLSFPCSQSRERSNCRQLCVGHGLSERIRLGVRADTPALFLLEQGFPPGLSEAEAGSRDSRSADPLAARGDFPVSW